MAQLSSPQDSPEREVVTAGSSTQEFILVSNSSGTEVLKPTAAPDPLLHVESTDSTEEWKELNAQRGRNALGDQEEDKDESGSAMSSNIMLTKGKGSPFSIVVALLVAVFAIFSIRNGYTCRVPGLEKMGYCMKDVSVAEEDVLKTPVIGLEAGRFEALLNVQSSSFEAAFDTASSTSSLKIQLLAARMAIDDLISAVHTSDMEWKDEIVIILKTYVDRLANAAKLNKENSLAARAAIDRCAD
ncbi:hypothetical protein M422DRAFT_254650 [Sphaerobolus stellatus SS14]|uniref:Transmembrane protein n=1 Tax=Sphaerobolus stellatus (strain SS14) TaxID=990650 RepID=A0A0C9V5P0_SPHS4|nr:hypothetical protein M422DRAFT_254650 [Sphaerobolus stellatus SS14]